MLIAAEKITKCYGEEALFKELSFYLEEGIKIGVIGINGAGKSTLLKIIAQLETPDSGTVTRLAGTRVGYLPQVPLLDEKATVLEQALSGATATHNEVQEYEAKTILNKLGLVDYDKRISCLSGGQKKRVALASVLIEPCEALILDEPTNHLDNDMVAWLENFLIRYTGAVIMVTHDRYFLDRVVSRIAEIDRGSLYTYEANYSKFVELKAQREEMDAGTQRKSKSILRKELAWMQRGARARGTKSKSRIERFEELNEKIVTGASSKLSLDSVSTRLGKKTVEIEGISKRFGEKQVIRDFSHIIARDARIGIIGPNGCGKSTLLNIISGRLMPDSGSVILGDTVKLGYFSQENEDMDISLRVIDYIKSYAEYFVTVDGTLSASQMLEKFLFPPNLQWNTIGKLSGGERRRLYLLSVLMTAPNILFLDEPTNDLDIETLIILEDYLESFSGAVVAVSHDRYFLDKVVDLIFEYQDGGKIRKCLGGYSDYMAERNASPTKQEADKTKEPIKRRETSATPPKLRFTFNEQRELATIDGEIAEIEQKLAVIEDELVAEASNYEILLRLLAQKEAIEQTLNEKTERWFYLHELADKIAAQASDNSTGCYRGNRNGDG
ncbi:MAG: ABC-F family ATP-binding cassette domain-containing protein [Sporomusa sp.]